MIKLTRFNLDMDGSMVPDPGGEWTRVDEVMDVIYDVHTLLECTHRDYGHTASGDMADYLATEIWTEDYE